MSSQRHRLTKGRPRGACPPATAVTDSGLQPRHTVTNHAGVLDDIDTVVLACGGEAVDELRRGLTAAGQELHMIGDCVSPRRLVHAILDGAGAGRARLAARPR